VVSKLLNKILVRVWILEHQVPWFYARRSCPNWR
jgi:hypothetical protein